MKLTHEFDVLKPENGNDLLNVFWELKKVLCRAVQERQPIHEVEKAVWEEVLRIGRQALGQFITQLGTGDMGETINLPDGRYCQRLEEIHERRYMSIFGEFTLRRTVYGSREKQKIEFVPLDNRLQLPDGVYSYVLQDWDQSFCVEQAFGPSAAAIARILGLRQSVDTLEKMNEELADHVMEFWRERAVPKASEEGKILVTGADGKGIVMRRTEPARVPAFRHKGEKASQKRMATVGTVYTVDPYLRTPEEVVAALFRDNPQADTKRRPLPQHKHNWASLPWSAEGEEFSGIDIVYTWLQEEVSQRNPDKSKEVVHLGDGQHSLWEARSTYLPDINCTDITDILHVASYVWDAAHAFYPEGSAEAQQFTRDRLLRILQGHSDRVVRGLREMATKRGLTGAKKNTVRKVCGYLEGNRERMHYDIYLAKGYPIATGAIEGACRHLVKDRMERAGMHWTLKGAQSMLNVRSVYINGDWEIYQSFRIQHETQRLYPFRDLITDSKFNMAV
jgi:hypothetical protein